MLEQEVSKGSEQGVAKVLIGSLYIFASQVIKGFLDIHDRDYCARSGGHFSNLSEYFRSSLFASAKMKCSEEISVDCVLVNFLKD
jgi:hypothetical protein